MKPKPMSDGQIANEWGMALMRHDTTREQLFDFARAIIAARDAQWAAMIGEPVAHIDTASLVALAQMSPRGHMTTNIHRAGFEHSSPLYAIKETPLNRRVDLATLAADLASGPDDIDVCGKYVAPKETP